MIAAEMKAVYVARLPQLLAELRRSNADLGIPRSGAAARLEAIAHRMKGSAGTFGLPEIGAKAAALESAATAELPGACGELIAAIESALAEASGCFRIAIAVSDASLANSLADRLADASRRIELTRDAGGLVQSLAGGELALAIVDRPGGSGYGAAALSDLAAAAGRSGATVLLIERDGGRSPALLPAEVKVLDWPEDAPQLANTVAGALQGFAMGRATLAPAGPPAGSTGRPRRAKPASGSCA